MSDERFDLIFEGLIAPGSDRTEARSRLTAIFKLSEQGAERLFTGKPVVVKRDVDAATAQQYETVFARAGAILTVNAKAGGAPEIDAADPEAPSGESDSTKDDPLSRIDTSHLSLAPEGGVLEEPVTYPERQIDTSYLSLVSEDGWSLEDCEPLPTPVLLPDLSGLSLVPQAPRDDSESRFD